MGVFHSSNEASGHTNCNTKNLNYLTPVTCPMSACTCHMVSVIYHLSPVIIHLSPVTFHLRQQPQPQTLPLITPPPSTVEWYVKKTKQKNTKHKNMFYLPTKSLRRSKKYRFLETQYYQSGSVIFEV